MSSYRQLLYHLVFRTKNSKPVIRPDNAHKLYSYMSGIIKNKNSHLYIINGVENHIHIITDIHPSIALADFMRDLKAFSSHWIKESGLFPGFVGWAEGYGAFTFSLRNLGKLIYYVENQQVHHRSKCFEDEYRVLLTQYGIRIDERYFP